MISELCREYVAVRLLLNKTRDITPNNENTFYIKIKSQFKLFRFSSIARIAKLKCNIYSIS